MDFFFRRLQRRQASGRGTLEATWCLLQWKFQTFTAVYLQVYWCSETKGVHSLYELFYHNYSVFSNPE